MEALKFKTDIKCSGCIAKATFDLDETVGKSNWEVDVANPQKILTIKNPGITELQVLEAVKKAGYKAERIN